MQVYSVEAKVNPSQKGPDHAHVAWMIARKDVQIVCIPLLKVIDSTYSPHMAILNVVERFNLLP